jgi:mRNA-degrading endonuclease toxin of MazEF toxin-antitoxin module
MTQIKTVDKRSLREKIGTLSKDRMDQVHDGSNLIMDLSESLY